ncbi:MAG TPA: SDR family NAD(P)-dependent oxidoreductase, partial [Chitinophagales bacterium]|nr:SDR family NAD(P)-dependent oxidoreductase [Chitinophagales bacterium]
MNIQLYPYTAMVCGSTQGIGKACAFELASMGARIVLVARDADKLNQVKQLLPNPHGVEHESIIADFSNPEQVRAAMHAYFSS